MCGAQRLTLGVFAQLPSHSFTGKNPSVPSHTEPPHWPPLYSLGQGAHWLDYAEVLLPQCGTPGVLIKQPFRQMLGTGTQLIAEGLYLVGHLPDPSCNSLKMDSRSWIH